MLFFILLAIEELNRVFFDGFIILKHQSIYKHFFFQLICFWSAITTFIFLFYLIPFSLNEIFTFFTKLIISKIIGILFSLFKLLFVFKLIFFLSFHLIFLNVPLFCSLIWLILLLILILRIIKAFSYLFPAEFSFSQECFVFINIFFIKII